VFGIGSLRGAGELNGFDGKQQLMSTLNHVVLEEELAAKRKDPSQKGNFTLLMVAIAGACKAIAHGVNRCLSFWHSFAKAWCAAKASYCCLPLPDGVGSA